MAKKSNKTEHVLNLITKGDEPPGSKNAQALVVEKHESEVDIQIKETQENELKIERKLKVEIEPDVHIKSSEKRQEELTVKAPDVKLENVGEPSELGDKRGYLINLTEKLVMEMADDVMKKTNVCTCAVCKNDVLALALNALAQNYVTSDAGKQYLQLEIYKKQYETDVLSALIKACVRVKAAPKHSER